MGLAHGFSVQFPFITMVKPVGRPAKVKDEAGQTPAGTPIAKTAITAAKTRPIRTFRVDNVSAAVWANTTVKLELVTYYSITFESHYQDSKGNERYGSRFRPNELPKIVSLCRQAEEYIVELQRQDVAQKTEQAPPAQ